MSSYVHSGADRLTIHITLVCYCRHMYPFVLDILQHVRFVPWINFFLFLIHFSMYDSEHDIERDLAVNTAPVGVVRRTKAARPPRTPPMIAPTGGFELSTAAPGGFGSVPLLRGPAGGMIVDDGLLLDPATTGTGIGAGAGVGGLPFPLRIS